MRPVDQAVNNFTGLRPRERLRSSYRFLAWSVSGFPAVLRTAVHASDSPVVAVGTLLSIIGPDHNSLGSVLSAVPRQTTGPGVGQGRSQLITTAWCLFPPLCTPALSVSPGLPLPTALSAVGAGCTPEMSGPQRQGSVHHTKLLRQKPGSELFCPRGTERNLQGVVFGKKSPCYALKEP